ncbi:laccase-15-like [Hordeum vulgare subsp. vulgare]|uniref:Laccase n=1 Tax=Hordeum vulgare subsp. vulgare TaxID=112509 RepID=A0A287GWL8_HORVV|nr:laccase-15-like [Hordeum vulgare subsp. vulgare]BDX35372.1 laccase [Hordeum vulgare subsp. vulgare]
MAAMAVLVAFFVAAALAAAGDGDAALVEHTFVVSQVKLNRLCNDTLVTVVNGQFPGPTIELNEGDSVAVHVINKSPHGITIHWHGVKMQLNCWADGAAMITQCPIQPNKNFTYRFDVVGQEGTLWWHAHVGSLRASVHGALIIRPRSGASSYPFDKPDKEIPIVIGEWWEMDLGHLEKNLRNGYMFDLPRAATINGKPGDLYNCSGTVKDNNVVNVEHGKSYLLRIVNAGLESEYYLKIAGHKFTVVAADANYVKPYTTDVIAIAPGETIDALLVADAHPAGRYYMVVKANQPPKPAIQFPLIISRGVVQYSECPGKEEHDTTSSIMVPEMPDRHDSDTSFYFHGNLTSLQPHPLLRPVPANVHEHLFYALDSGNLCPHGESSCINHLGPMINNVSFRLPATTPLLQAHYHGNMSSISTLRELPDRAPRMFNFTKMRKPTSRATSVRRLRYNATVEIVFQSPVLADTYANPMHLHGQDMFVLAQGLGRYDAEKDVATYNLVDPPVRNTVLVPLFGWAVVRFVTKNPGVWFLHCHFENHSSGGMAVAFVVENGPTLDSTLPPPPEDLPSCYNYNSRVAYE